MAAPDQKAVRNRLLALMEAEDWARLAPHLLFMDLPRGLQLAEVGEPLRAIYFFESGIGSTLAVSPEGEEVEVGLTGADGFGPVELIMEADLSPNRTLMQVEGAGWRLDSEPLAAALAESATLRNLLLRYAHCRAMQAAYTALSNAVHPVDRRLARWLLMCDGRIDSGELSLTHEFIAGMLAVRRPSVTTMLHVLEGHGFIRLERGRIIVRSRAAMEAFAGDAYGKPEAEYHRLIGPMRA